MEHNDARHKLSEYIDGSASAEDRAAIEEHLKACSACSDALRELRKTVEHIKSIEEVEPPAWMTQKIMARVRGEAEEKKSLFRRFFFPLSVRLPIQAVAVLFLAVTAFYIYRNIQPAPAPSEAPVQEFAVRNEAPPAPAPRDKREEPKITKDAAVPAKKLPQAPGYKALDMKPEYEKPAPPVALDKAAESAPVPGKADEAPRLAQREAAMERRAIAPQAGAPEVTQEKQAASAKNQIMPDRKTALIDKGVSLNKSKEAKRTNPVTALRMVEDVAIVTSCKTHPELSGDCFIIHGRLDLADASPSMRIWNVSTKKYSGVYGMTDTLFSQNSFVNASGTIEKNLDFNAEIFGDFLVCPLTPEKEGVMRHLCVESATDLTYKQKQ